MKKWMAILLTLAICLGLAACGEEPVATTEPTEPPTAREQLSAEEERLFSVLITITTEDFYEPSTVRVLEVYDYDDRTYWEEYEDSNDEVKRSSYEHNYGPECVTVRLQAENRVGGTVNHYYRVCMTGAENTSDFAKEQLQDCWLYGRDVARMGYKAETGEYVNCGDYYEPKEEAEEFDVGKINRALKEYWDEMGF